MKNNVPGYYILDKPQRGAWSEYVRKAGLLFNWASSFFFKRIIINIALGPNEIRLQDALHVMFLTDDRSEKGSVIINLLPPESNTSRQNYFNKLPSLSSEVTRQEFLLDNPEHKAYIDSMIDEIGRLLNGTSNHNKCKNKKFAIEDLHIKGIERLDAPLKVYFKEQVQKKYGIEFFERPRTIGLDFYTLETADNAMLESVEVSSAEEKMKPVSERKFVISCMARNQNYMYWLKDFYTSSSQIGCSVISFNYRGIDYSRGIIFSQEELVNDVLAQAQRLIEMGVKPENITFEGMSMGGAVSTIATARMHDKDAKVHLYNERSYRSLARLIVGYVLPSENSNPWHPKIWLQYAIAGLAYLFITPVLWMSGWHLNAARSWDKIPLSHKTFAVARNHENPEQYDDDDFVHDSFSSIASLMDEHRNEVKQKQAKGETLSPEQKHLLADKPESHEFTLNRNDTTNHNPSSHSAPRRFLLDTKSRKTTLQNHMISSVGQMMNAKSTEPKQSEITIPEYESLNSNMA